MPRYIAFLRSINVGGRNVKMDELRRFFEAMGFSRVETFIASGNVIFESASRSAKSLETKIANKLQQKLGYKVGIFVRSNEQLSAIARHKFFTDQPGEARLYIAFLSQPPDEAAWAKLSSLQTRTDIFQIEGRELYWTCLTGFSDSIFSGPLLEKTLGVAITVRNSSTVSKIAAKCG